MTQHAKAPEGRRYGPDPDFAKFAEVRQRYEAGETLNLLARAYGVGLNTIADYVRKAGGSVRRPGGKRQGLITGRPIAVDDYAADMERLDALSRQRALTLDESLRLEECIGRLARREQWRTYSRRKAAGLVGASA